MTGNCESGMVEQITFQTLFQFLQTISIMVGITYYLMILNNQQKNQQAAFETRQAQLFMQIHSQWKDREFIKGFYDILNRWEWKDNEDFWAKYGQDANEEAFITMIEIGWYFEGVGQLLRDKLIDIRLVDAMYSDRVIRLWEKSYPIVVGLREQYRNPDYYGNYEYLYKELKKRQVKP
jgi:hypothetical protein